MYSSPYSAAPPYYSTPNSQYYSPRYTVYESTPKHTRRASDSYGYSYASPRGAYYYTTPDRDQTPRRTTSQRKADPVSGFNRTRSNTKTSKRYTVAPEDDYGHTTYRYHVSEEYDPYKSSRYAPNGVYADYQKEDYLPAYDRKYRYSPPPDNRQPTDSYRNTRADYQTPHDYDYYRADESPSTKRPRRASHGAKPTRSPPKPQSKPPPRKATDADARDAGIPAGYSTKHWDPNEEPILLLGSVFDANSLGKWIYDWTVACHGPATPMSEVAGDLWVLLIQLAGKVKRAEKCLPRVRSLDNRDMIDDFVESGERLQARFSKLLKICEQSMLKSAKRDKTTKKIVVGKNSGRDFVDCIFGRDGELHRTEKIMASIRLWSHRFDANCEDILRDPRA